jgi:hypothetical protein
MALADPAAILAKIAFHVHRDRKARGESPRERAANGSQRPLNPNSKFFRDKMPALGKTKLSVIHSFCGFRRNTVLPLGAGQTPTRVKHRRKRLQSEVRLMLDLERRKAMFHFPRGTTVPNREHNE